MGSPGVVLRSIGVGVFPVCNLKLKDVILLYTLMVVLTVQNQRLVVVLILCLAIRDVWRTSVPITDQY